MNDPPLLSDTNRGEVLRCSGTRVGCRCRFIPKRDGRVVVGLIVSTSCGRGRRHRRAVSSVRCRCQVRSSAGGAKSSCPAAVCFGMAHDVMMATPPRTDSGPCLHSQRCTRSRAKRGKWVGNLGRVWDRGILKEFQRKSVPPFCWHHIVFGWRNEAFLFSPKWRKQNIHSYLVENFLVCEGGANLSC